MKLKNALSVAGLGSIALAGICAMPAQAAQDIPVAMVGPLTGSNAATGEQMKRGVQQAVEDINAKGGVLGGKLVLSLGDDACDPKQAVAVANQMASKGVLFVDGHDCSGSSIPASAVYNDAGIVQITPASTNPRLTEEAFKKGWTNVYRTCGRDDQQGAVAGKYLIDHFKGKNFAIVDDKSAYGKGLADETRKALNAGGIKEVVDDEITAGEKDFSALISKLKQANVDVIYYGGYPTEAGLLMRQAHEQGMNATLMSGDAMATTEFWSITGNVGEGSLFTFAPDPKARPEAKAVVDEFAKAGYPPEGYTLYTYAAMQVYAQAVDQAKSTKLDDVVKVLHSNTFDTVIGPIKYDAKGDITEDTFVVWKMSNGKFAPVAP